LLSPLAVQGASDLHGLGEKLQKKEMVVPIHIALTYPLDKKEPAPGTPGAAASSKKGGEQAQIHSGGAASVQAMVLVPAGPAIVQGKEVLLEDYLISVFPVTNEHYADWLNDALDGGKITLGKDGVVRDRYRHVLCKIYPAAPTSQIEILVSGESVFFSPLKEKQQHPVVQVSRTGAQAWCADNGFRLPDEAEWEKAAGTQEERAGQPPNCFRYGSGSDEIDLTLANFRDEFREYRENYTTAVGFYNGMTVFTKKGKNYQSKNACSPWGCYDMSGNVWEWVSNDVEGRALSKGGSYNTPPEELQVVARNLLDPGSCYADTGFRVVFDLR
jgi:formylglycine-generating enzyme required for sulfatase activity